VLVCLVACLCFSVFLILAHELSKHSSSVQVTVLEARNRLGGRLDTRHHLLSGPQGQEIPLDFGASWIHGIDPTNPVMPLAEASQAALVPTNTDVIFYRPGQQPLSEHESNHYWAVLWEIFGQAQDHSRANKNEISAQTSFRDWLDHYLKTRQSRDPRKPNFMSARELRIVPLLAQFWADENAIPLNKVSLKYMDAEILPPGDHCIMANGYDRIVDTLCKDMGKVVDIRLEHVVDRIEYDGECASKGCLSVVGLQRNIHITNLLLELTVGSIAFNRFQTFLSPLFCCS